MTFTDVTLVCSTALLVLAALAFAYWIGYHHGTHQR